MPDNPIPAGARAADPPPVDRPQGDRPQVDVEAAKHDYRFLKLLAVVSLVVASASQFTLNLVDPDLWGHVAYGRELLADGALPRTATHTFTAEGYRWINHENLAEIVFAVGFDAVGVKGMLVAKCLLGLAILGVMYGVARRHGVRTLAAWGLLLLVATNLKAFFPMRPQLLSFACCTVMLWLLDSAFRDWRNQDRTEHAPACRVRWAWLLAVPALLVVWVNSHGGFVAGYCILGVLLAGRAIEAIAVDRRRAAPVVAGMTAIGLACLGGLLINPYGTGLVGWLIESLGSPRPEITEWAAPKMKDPVFWPFVTLLVVNAVAWGFTDRRRDWVQLAILTLVAWQACLHLRHIAFFALLSGFWTPVHVQSVVRQLRNRAAAGLPVTQIGPVMKWAMTGAFAVAIIGQSANLANRLTQLPVSRTMYPVDAFDFLSLHGINGRMVVSFNWAQYALAAFPDSTVSFDGRFRTCYPQEVVDMNFDFLLGEHRGLRHRSPDSGPIDGAKVLDYRDPEIVVVDRNYKHAVRVMKEASAADDSEWFLFYQDSVAQLWGRKSVFDSAESDRFLPREARYVTDAARPLAVQWPAMPLRPPANVAKQDTAPVEGDS